MQTSLASFPAGSNTVIGSSPDILRAINDPAVDLAICERRLPADLPSWLEKLPAQNFPSGRVLVDVDRIEAAVSTMFEIARTPSDRNGQALLSDVVFLAQLFAEIAKIDIVDIRLDAIHHDACWKFHRDLVELRMLTTYLGPGTQIVPQHLSDKALRQQRDFAGALAELPTQAVAIFKGSNDNVRDGVVHRSPPIARSGAHRFVLCINKISRASPMQWHA